MADGLRIFDLVILLLQSDESSHAAAALAARVQRITRTGRVVVIHADRRMVERRLMHAALHRAAFQRALDLDAQRPLMIEEGCLLHADADRLFAPSARALAGRDWRLVSLGAAHDEAAVAPCAPDAALATGVFEGCFANGYRREALTAFLADMPADSPRLADWIAREASLEVYIARAEGRMLSMPRVATLPHLLPYEDPALRDGFA